MFQLAYVRLSKPTKESLAPSRRELLTAQRVGLVGASVVKDNVNTHRRKLLRLVIDERTSLQQQRHEMRVTVDDAFTHTLDDLLQVIRSLPAHRMPLSGSQRKITFVQPNEGGQVTKPVAGRWTMAE